MKLVIAEKPSVAQSLARVLGVSGRKDGYLESPDFIVSWCIGHLVRLADAGQYNPAYAKWNAEDLPILPEPWRFVIHPGTKKQFDILQSLMERLDVDSLVEATDAGREGESIFRLVYEQAGCKKPVERLWLSSMEDSAIREGFATLRDSADYDTLYAAALCRAKADWLVGINATRLFSTRYRHTLNVGRVMTPTLALLVERQQAIDGFQKAKFYTVSMTAGGIQAESARMEGKQDAEKICSLCKGQTAVVTKVEQREKKAQPPHLYDLTTLQREANRAYGYTAQQTLDTAQALYEKKLITYPRTDSQYLTEDMAAGLPELAGIAARILLFPVEPVGEPNVSRAINNEGVADHHALLPTRQAVRADLTALPTPERNILTMLAVRLLCALDRPNLSTETTITLHCGGFDFTARGVTTQDMGWKAVELAWLASLKVKPDEKDNVPLPDLAEGQEFPAASAAVHEGTTSPPKAYSEDTLLLAMECAGKEDLPEDAERKGLGTPATRAGIIEKLVKAGFAERKSKRLVPTETGINLISILPEPLTSPLLTAEWENRLKRMERGQLSPDEFMEGIKQMVQDMVQNNKAAPVDGAALLFAPKRESVGKCPRCGGEVYEGKQNFYCQSRECGFTLWKNDRFFLSKKKELTKEVAAALLKKGRVKMTGLFSEKKGTTYDATIVLDDTGGRFINFKLEFEKGK